MLMSFDISCVHACCWMLLCAGSKGVSPSAVEGGHDLRKAHILASCFA